MCVMGQPIIGYGLVDPSSGPVSVARHIRTVEEMVKVMLANVLRHLDVIDELL
jgi:hypothetical protein